MKKTYIFLCFMLTVFSCEKDGDLFENKLQRIISTKQYTNGVLSRVENYGYDKHGRLISLESSSIDENGEPYNSFERTFEYEQNKIVEYHKAHKPGGIPMNKTEREIENGLVSKIFGYYWNGEAWEVGSRVSYIYDGSNKLSRWNEIYLGLFAGMTEGEIIYERNLPTQKIEKRYNHGSFWGPGQKSTYYKKETYSYAGGWLQETKFYHKRDNAEDWECDGKTGYLRSGQEIEETNYGFAQEEFIPAWIKISTYDGHGNITKTKTINPNNDNVIETTTEYENKPGNWEAVLEDPDRDIVKSLWANKLSAQ